MSEPQLQPDADDLVGVEDDGTPFVVPVRIADLDVPLRVRQLPSHAASVRSVTVTSDGVQLLPRDPRRRRAVITATDAVQIGVSQSGAQSNAFLLPLAPNLPPFEYTALTELWAAVAPGALTLTVSVLTELWAD